MRVFPKSQTFVLFSNKQVMGWAFALEHDSSVSLSLFVNERYRNRGCATQLVHEALKEFPEVSVFNWSGVTAALSEKLKQECPGRIHVINWSKSRRVYEKLITTARS